MSHQRDGKDAWNAHQGDHPERAEVPDAAIDDDESFKAPTYDKHGSNEDQCLISVAHHVPWV
ncbi:hypothetical protein [Lysobacter sp.]|uniref:hypothetical protein n=1 Tax=Lysobacter sp. TaxID=72226 RepID=UPI002D6691BB|nr:hypothetical protein [Lysobacter sp.]HZX78561.1 hypothetical protein [Lysobacter sp.]